MEFLIDALLPAGLSQVRRHLPGGKSSPARPTFEGRGSFLGAVGLSAHHSFGRLVARSAGRVIGWAALSQVSQAPLLLRRWPRVQCLRGDGSTAGRGVGRQLLLALIAESERARIWTLQGATFPENECQPAACSRVAGFGKWAGGCGLPSSGAPGAGHSPDRAAGSTGRRSRWQTAADTGNKSASEVVDESSGPGGDGLSQSSE